MKNCEIDIRDTYVMPYDGKYYLYGTEGFGAFKGTPKGYLCYVGTDLENWEGPYTVFPNDGSVWASSGYWAPEVYEIKGSFYMFTAWTAPGRQQRLCVLKAEDPLGPFKVVCDDLGPGNDPTLYQEGDKYYLIHNDGSDHMQAHLFNSDFSGFVGEAIQMFDRTDPDVTWAVGGPTEGAETFVTPTGRLLVLWSSFCRGSSKKFAAMGLKDMDYGTAISHSDNGLQGPFVHEDRMITPANMGHCNLFYRLDGQLMLATHWPDDDNNELGCSTPIFFPVNYDAEKDTLTVDTAGFVGDR